MKPSHLNPRIGFLLLCLSVAPTEAAVVRMSQVDLVAGQTLTLRLDAAATRNLTSAAVVTTVGGRITAAPAVSTSLTASRDGARWLRITARSDAPQQQYQVHGLSRNAFAGIVPVAVRVIPPPVRGARVSPSVLWNSSVPVSRTTQLDQPVPYRTVYRGLTDLIREAPEVTVELGNFGGSVPAPGGRDVYGPERVSIVVAPNTQVTGIAPENIAPPGGELVISGQELPSQVAVRLADVNLQVLSASSTMIRARLPSQSMSGALVLVRLSDGSTAMLDDNYQVSAPAVSANALAFDGFDSDATGFSWRNTYLLSLLSWLAYADPEVAAVQAAAWGLSLGSGGSIDVVTPYFFGQSGSTQALVLYNAESVFVAFQGSTTGDFFQDWVDNDFDVLPQPANHWGAGVVLHHGFTEAMSIAYPQVLSQVQSLMSGGRKLWITGHSLGAAVASLTAYRLRHENGIEVQGVNLFGSPPVGNVIWSQMFASKVANTQRWNVEYDPIPSLLPPLLFSHVGIRNNLYSNGSYLLNDPHFFVYPPSPSFFENLLVTHMSYWCRLYEEIQEHEPGIAQQMPPPPTFDAAPCGT